MPLSINDKDETNEMLLVHEIARQLRFCFDRRVKHLGLTRSQWRVLSVVRRNPNIRQNQIAFLLEVEPITVVRTLDRMENNGWIKRKTDPKDKRANQINLTKKVEKILGEMKQISIATRKDALADFSDKDHQKFLGYLSRVKSNINLML
jgi:MarR family transcriptional regulator, transcriptional regulator for hemolysin